MKSSVALFRGINVGGHNKLPMVALRELLTDVGCDDVRTYIQSGNAVFRTDSLPEELERHIGRAVEQRFGFRPRVLVLDAATLRAIADANPFPEATSAPASLHVLFLSSRPAQPDLAALAGVKAPSESFKLTDRAFYLHAPDGIARSKLAAKAERALGVDATARNWRTVSKLLEWL